MPEGSSVLAAAESARLFVGLCARADEIHIASAWASDATPPARALWAARSKIAALVVGLAFYQTDPEFLRRFRPWVRVLQRTDGTFHPKVYVFRRGMRVDAIVGSSNLTRGGFGSNDEVNVHLSGTASDAFYRALRRRIEELAFEGNYLTEGEVAHYERQRRRALAHVERLQTFKPRARSASEKRADLDVPWRTYVRELRAQERRSGHRLFPENGSPGYVGVVEDIRALFRRYGSLSRMPLAARKGVAGLVEPFLFFGSMRGAGRFKNAVAEKAHLLDEALAHIPQRGPISRAQLEAFRATLPSPGMSRPAVGSRLLAMKRPDLLLCIDSANRRKLAKAFGFSPGRLNTYEGYWELLERLWRLPWFQSPRPRAKEQRRLWDARVALLDAFYYEP